MKKYRKIISILLLICLCITTVLQNTDVFAGNSEQIEYKGEESKGNNIAVSKIINETDQENVFDITLKVDTKSEIHKILEQPPMSVVIVLDISNTMFSSANGANINTPSRFTDAMTAIESFIDAYVDSAEGADVPRELALVTFNTNAHVQQKWINCAENDIHSSEICSDVISNIEDTLGNFSKYKDSNKRYTNIESGLRLAENLMDDASTENKYIILLTDGMPTTYSVNHSDTSSTYIEGYEPLSSSGKVGNDGVFYDNYTKKYCEVGVSYSDIGAKYAQTRAENIKTKGISIYSVGIDIGSTTIDKLVRNSSDFGSVVDCHTTTNSYVIENSAEDKYDVEYKNWLYNEIGSKYYSDGNDTSQIKNTFGNILNVMHESSKEYVVNAWNAADPMNSNTSTSKNVEFLTFIKKDGSFSDELSGASNEGSENTASFDKSSETINWTILESGYVKSVVGNETTYSYELKYRIRLKNEEAGFIANNPVDTNGTTTLSYIENDNGKMSVKSIEYKVPKVEGYFGEFSFYKIDDEEKKISGVEFELSHNEDCTVCKQIDNYASPVTINKFKAISKADGKVSFSNIPSGHDYILKEISAPDGYVMDTTERKVNISYGKVTVDGLENFYTVENVIKKYKLNYVIVGNDKPDVATPNEVINIPHNTNQGLAATLTTEDTTSAGENYTWVFEGWYDNEECQGNPITSIVMTSDKTVYGKWKKMPEYVVKYIVEPDENYGVPEGTSTPVDSTKYDLNNTVTVANKLSTSLNTADGIPGTWIFNGWRYSDGSTVGDTFTITDNTVFYGDWDFIPDTYKLNYKIVSTNNPTGYILPGEVNNIAYDTLEVLANKLSTTMTTDSIGQPGEWKFLGWYDNEACDGNPVEIVNITSDTTVYGKWEFEPVKYNVKYEVTGDSEYGVPGDTQTPSEMKDLAWQTKVIVDNTQNTSWTKSDATANGIPGTWIFTGWLDSDNNNINYTEFNIEEDTVFYGNWNFEPTPYSLTYKIVSTDNPDISNTDSTPSKVEDIAYNTNVTLEKRLNTNAVTNSVGEVGAWRFSGWYLDEECSTNRVETLNIKTDMTVYGRWDFVKNKYIVNYVVEPDNIYGKPGDVLTPIDENNYNNGDKVEVKPGLSTKWTTSDGTPEGIPGKWTFEPWDKNDFEISDNTTIKGGWKFTPDTYTLEYRIVSTQNPDEKLTDKLPSKVINIDYNTEETLDGKLTTTDNKKDFVEGAWRFRGWYDNEECKGNPISKITINENKIVYGKWEFITDKLIVDYIVTEDPIYGKPLDVVPPTDFTNYDYGDQVDVKDNLKTEWTTSDGTPKGIPGEWEFVPWDTEDFIILKNTKITGVWKFTPKKYTLEYVIVSKDNPNEKLTEFLPKKITDIDYDTDIELVKGLITTDTENDGVKGKWSFYGWYDNEGCEGKPINIKNIKSDSIVYGKWIFVSDEIESEKKEEEETKEKLDTELGDGHDKDKEEETETKSEEENETLSEDVGTGDSVNVEMYIIIAALAIMLFICTGISRKIENKM